MSDISVVDNPAKHRYEALIGDVVAGFAEYRLRPGRIVFTHTEVAPEFEGHGIGSALAAGALTDVRQRGLTIVPLCPFIAEYIGGHPEYADLVAVS